MPLPSNVHKYTLTFTYIHDTMISTESNNGTVGALWKMSRQEMVSMDSTIER